MRFVLFFLIFSTLYGALHAYAFIKVRHAFSLGVGGHVFLGLYMLFMVLCPIFVRLLERAGIESVARSLAFVGYLWMGILFLFICSSFVIDVYRLLAHLVVFIFKREGSSWWAISPGGAFYIALVVSVVTAAWGVLEAGRIRFEHITIRSSKIPEGIDRVRIVQISDIHLGLIVREGRLEKILRKVKEAEPDVLVSTGDLVDGQTNDLSKMAEMFRKIPAKYGKFAVTGNHEYYAGLDRSLAFTEAAGFSILRGKGVQVGGLIQVVGVDDPAGKRFGLKRAVSEEDLLSGLEKRRFILLLKHRPLVNEKSSGLFDLQLSGHAHKGQIFPFSLIIKMLYPIDAGLLALEKGGHLYVSRGTGTWGPPMRFLAPPEVTVIDLVHLEEKSSSWQS